MNKLIALLVGLLITGCINNDDPDIDLACRSAITHSLSYESEGVWQSPTINVCWDNPDIIDDPVKLEWVKEAAESSWEAVSAVDFVGWRPCDLQFEHDIVIVIRGAPLSGVFGLGMNSDGENLMWLNLLEPEVYEELCGSSAEECIKTIAVHEFGHSLGFAHEQNREDTPLWCKLEQNTQGSSGDQTIGEWDVHSVMNYCNPEWSGNGQLSCGDIKSVREVYGN